MVLILYQFLMLFYVFSPSEQKCELRKKNPFNCDEIMLILNFHNEARSRVALGQTKLPEAMDMWVLKWDETLARMAQEWANNCVYKRNENLPEGVGENLSWQSSNGIAVVDVQYLIGMWYDEIEKYDPEGSAVLQDGTGHLTQVIWGNTKYIGCGVSIYQDGDDEEIYKTLLVCHYRPAGNIEGENLYLEYEHFERCHRGVESQQYSGLCAHDLDHSLGNYMPCDSGSETLRPTKLFILFLLYCYYHYNF